MKKYLRVLIIGFLAFALVACGNKTGSSDEAEEKVVVGDDVEGATPLTFWTFQELHMEFFEEAVGRWNEEFPEKAIKLTAETYPYDQMHNNLLLALQSGKGAPDIVDIEISRFPNYLQGEPQLLPMNDLVEPEMENFVESRFEIYSKDGNYYGIPTHVGASVMYYNTEIMDQAGVDIDSIKTWDDFVEAGKQVVEKTDAKMFNISTDDYLPFWSMISQRGADWFDEKGNLTIDDQKIVDTLQFAYDIIYTEEIAEIHPGGAPHAEEFYAYMNSGGAAAITMPLWYMGRFIDYMPDLKGKITVRPMPAWDEGGNRSAGMGGTGTVVTNQTESPDLAKEFLAYTKLSKEGNIKLWTVLGFDPPRWDVWESEEVQASNKFYEFFGDNIFDVLLDIKDEISPVNITEYTPDVAQEMDTNVMNDVIRQQSLSPKEALEKAKKNLESTMQ